MLTKKALLILTGKTFENCLNRSSIEALKKNVIEELSSRAMPVIRFSVLLSKDHFFAAELFLQAGFDIIPADDEVSQAILECIMAAGESTPPDEIVFSFGTQVPARILQYLAGRTQRTLLSRGQPNSEHLIHLEHYIDISDFLVENPTVAEESPSFLTNLSDAVEVSIENLPVDDPLADTAWQDRLEDYVRRNDGKIPATKVFSLLKDDFPLIWSYYTNKRPLLIERIPSSLRWIVEEDIPMIYQRNHRELKPISAAEAQDILTFGDGLHRHETESSSGRFPAQDFDQISIQADVMKKQCFWSADRVRLTNAGASYQEILLPRDLEMEKLGKEFNVFLWPIRYTITEEEYRTMGECYRGMEEAFRLLYDVQNSGKIPTNSKYLFSVAQAAATSLCLVKSTLLAFGLELGIDNIQRESFHLLVRFTKESQFYLANLRLGDRMDWSHLPELFQEIESLRAQFVSEQKSIKTMRNVEKQLEYHLKKIGQNPSSASDDWKKVIEVVTTLHDEFRIPASSLLFRKYLIDLIDQVPTDLDITDSFGKVVQEIDLFRERPFEGLEPEEEVEAEMSPALQKVRQRYGGTKVVFIGGTPQQHLRERLEKKFGITLIWSETQHKSSIMRYAPLLNDDEVSLFLVFIPWCSHVHSEELMQMVRESDKEFVRLRKGTNPEQIAMAICSQIRELVEAPPVLT